MGMAVIMGGIQGGGMRSLAARYRERALVVGGSVLLAGSLLATPWSPTVPLLLVPLALAAGGRAVIQPSLMSLASMRASPSDRGIVMGTFQSAASLARIGGPVVAGLLYDRWLPGPFVLAGGLVLGVAWIGRGLPAREGATEPQPQPAAPGEP